MSRGKRQLSLIGQVDARLNGMLALGQSKHKAKKDGTAKDHIYSGNTLDRYKKDCCRFMNWVTDAVRPISAWSCLQEEWKTSQGADARTRRTSIISAKRTIRTSWISAVVQVCAVARCPVFEAMPCSFEMASRG